MQNELGNQIFHERAKCQVGFNIFQFLLFRLTGRSQVHPEGPGAADADRVVGDVCNPHFRNHRTRVLLGCSSQNVLLNIKPK
jgi:hypothetical protein